MMQDVIALTQALCAQSSTTGSEGAVMAFVAELLAQQGYEVKKQPLFNQPERFNVYAAWPGEKPEVLLSTHLDCVPPFIEARLSDDGEWLVGRGVCDAKGIAAAMICAAQTLKQLGEKRVALLFVVGEEVLSDGAKAAVQDFLPHFRYIINGEPTDMKLAIGMKGAIVFDLQAEGKAGHSAYPDTGASALHQLCLDIATLLSHPWPEDVVFGKTTLNVGTLQGGVAGNVIAPSASARCVMRTSVEVQGLLDAIKTLLHPTTKLVVHSASSPMHMKHVEGFETCIVAFGSDVPHLKSRGVPLLIGPGSILDAHTAHEKVRVEDLRRAVDFYGDLSRRLLV